MNTLKDASPKRSKGQGADWYPYYAGFSARFADEALRGLSLDPGSTVLDPWNGSGTTTTRAVLAGHRSVGVDINPAMALIAAGRLATKADVQDACRLAEVVSTAPRATADDPLCFWFGPSSAGALRAMAQKIVLEYSNRTHLSDHQQASAAAVYFAGLGLVVRGLLHSQATTNPAWHRQTASGERRISISSIRLAALLKRCVDDLVNKLPEKMHASCSTLYTADCRDLPIQEDTIDAILTSPPYCTRLDYPIAMQPELALLGQGPGTAAFRELRERSHGTPTVRTSCPPVVDDWGDSCLALLSAIKGHSSRASLTYYYKIYAQYFSDLAQSLSEMTRVSRKNASCIIVVQSSWYKELPVALPDIVSELLIAQGWLLRHRTDYHVRHTLADTNPASVGYRVARGAVESALQLTLG